MDGKLKNVINKTIEREYYRVTDNFDECLKKNPEWAKDHDAFSNKVDELAEKLREVVPEEYKELVDKLIDVSLRYASVEGKMFFKEGLILGNTEVSYLGEIGAELMLI